MKKQFQPLTLAALYARVSSDRQDVDLSVAAQTQALKEYAKADCYSVAREYVDEAESGKIADRPEFRKMIEEGEGQSSLRCDSRLEIQPLHPQAGARRGLQGPIAAQGHLRRLDHRAGRGQRHRKAALGHHRVGGRILLGKFSSRGRAWDAGGRVPWFPPRLQGALRLHPHQGQRRGEGPPHSGG